MSTDRTCLLPCLQLALKAPCPCPHLIWIWSASISHLSHFVRNWIATGSINFDPVRTTNLTCDDSYTRPNYGHMKAYLPLAVTVLFLYSIQLALDTVCAPYTQQRFRFLYSPMTTRHLLQTRSSINELVRLPHDYFISDGNPLLVQIQSTY